jgi:2-polyprenyl-3-methyl-5-hydroxy-6-metoxy-1,4-benzoquinol methylase
MITSESMSSLFEFRRIVCPTCGVDDTRVWGQRGGRAHRGRAGEECTIVRCRRCDLLYANPFPFPKDLDSLYSGTEGFFDSHPDHATKTDDRATLVASLEQLTQGRRLLDVGAGTGETVAAALRRGWDAYGVESAARFASDAAEASPGRIHHGTLEETPSSFLGEPYDAVVLAAVLEHLHDPNRVLGTISRILKPGGILYVDVPNESGLYFAIGNLWNKLQGRSWVVNLAPTFSPYHVFGFNKKSLTAMLAKNALLPIRWHVYGGRSVLPLLPSIRGAAEWLASKTVHAMAKVGDRGTYIECYARKIDHHERGTSS